MNELRSYEHYRQHTYRLLEEDGYQLVSGRVETVGKQFRTDDVDIVCNKLFFKYTIIRKKKVYESDHKYISVIDHLSQLPIIIEEERKFM